MWRQYGCQWKIILLHPDGHIILVIFSIVFNTPPKQHLDFSSAVISPFIKDVALQVSNINQARLATYVSHPHQRSN